MSDPEKAYQAAHEIGRVYDAITDSKVLNDFFLMTLCRFIPAKQNYLFLATRNKTLLLEAAVPPTGEIFPEIVADAQKVLEDGKLRAVLMSAVEAATRRSAELGGRK